MFFIRQLETSEIVITENAKAFREHLETDFKLDLLSSVYVKGRKHADWQVG